MHNNLICTSGKAVDNQIKVSVYPPKPYQRYVSYFLYIIIRTCIGYLGISTMGYMYVAINFILVAINFILPDKNGRF